jgi:hypothetical protein
MATHLDLGPDPLPFNLQARLLCQATTTRWPLLGGGYVSIKLVSIRQNWKVFILSTHMARSRLPPKSAFPLLRSDLLLLPEICRF